MTMLDGALQLHEYGFTVFPTVPDESKNPYIEAWKPYQTADSDDDQITRWWQRWENANPAIVTGKKNGVIVVDADCPGAIEYIENSGLFPRTPLRVKTGKGKHYYYAVPNFEIRNFVRIKDRDKYGIDIRGVGGYVVAPPSVHFTGRVYEWEIDDHFDINHLIDLPTLTNEHVYLIKNFGIVSAVPPTPQALGNLDSVPGPVEVEPVDVGARNNKAAQLTGKYINEGMSLVEIKQAMDSWNQSNQSPLSDDELNTTIASVSRTSMSKNHNVIPFQQPQYQTGGNIQTFSYGDLIDSPPPLPEFFWRDHVLFCGSISMIAGPPKVGKSHFVMSMFMAAACGADFMGFPFSRPLRVLWLQAEIQKPFVLQRMGQAAQWMSGEQIGLVRENFRVTDRMMLNINDLRDYEAMAEAVMEVRPDIICVDPFINFCVVEENDNQAVHQSLKRFITLKDINGPETAALCLVHHTAKKVDRADPFSSIRGASAFRAAYDTGTILMDCEGQRAIEYECRNGPAPQGHFCPVDDEGRYHMGIITEQSTQPQATKGSGADEKKLNQMNAALGVLGRQCIVYSEFYSRVSKVLDISQRTARRIVDSLRDEGLINTRQEGKCVYTWNPAQYGGK